MPAQPGTMEFRITPMYVPTKAPGTTSVSLVFSKSLSSPPSDTHCSR